MGSTTETDGKTTPTGVEGKTTYTLLRLGTGREDHILPEGATLADLLRAAGVGTENQTVFLDEKPIEECLVLKPGTIVSLLPRSRSVAAGTSWQDGVGMFRDDPGFQGMMKVVEANRMSAEGSR